VFVMTQGEMQFTGTPDELRAREDIVDKHLTV